jgi:probable rRNA maturation factor
MIEVEVFGASRAPGAPSQAEIRDLCRRTAASMGVHGAHVAIEFVDARRIEQLNAEHRDRPTPTDVLSFPIDGVEPLEGTLADHNEGASQASAPALPRELGDVVICPEHTADLREAIVHGMLHLLGMDHETDDGEMLALQSELLAGVDG